MTTLRESDPEFLHLPPECALVDSERLGGLAAVAIVLAQRVEDRRGFRLPQWIMCRLAVRTFLRDSD